MSQEWKRPVNIPFPNTWHKFKGKKEINGSLPNFWIQDIPEDLYDIATDIMSHNFIKDTVYGIVINAHEDEQYVEERRKRWRKHLDFKVSLVCFMENPDNSKGKAVIAGLNILYVLQKGTQQINEEKMVSETFSKIDGAFQVVASLKDPFEHFKFNECLRTNGYLVLPNFRGNGIGKELMMACDPLGKALGLKAIAAVPVSIYSQRILLDQCEFEVISEMDYEDLEKLNPKFSFPGISNHVKSLKFAVKIFK